VPLVLNCCVNVRGGWRFCSFPKEKWVSQERERERELDTPFYDICYDMSHHPSSSSKEDWSSSLPGSPELGKPHFRMFVCVFWMLSWSVQNWCTQWAIIQFCSQLRPKFVRYQPTSESLNKLFLSCACTLAFCRQKWSKSITGRKESCDQCFWQVASQFASLNLEEV
jgi:hypothetical protein